MNKNEVIEQILKIMQENDVTIANIAQALKAKNAPKVEETFDLLCDINGELKRVPFETGRALNPKGIFPFKKQKYYINLEETGMVPYPPQEDKDRLLDEDKCLLLMDIRTELNERLRELGKPILSGDYWLNGHELSGIGYWMARIREDRSVVDYYDASKTAKVRYVGHI